jgi:hypothetical protein
MKRGKMCYGKECVEDVDYWEKGHEVEAREQEETLYLEYLSERNPVPVSQVAQFFLNRLMQAV